MSIIKGFNPEFFSKSSEDTIATSSGDDIVVVEEKKKRGRPKKKIDSSEIVTVEESSPTELSMLQSNTPYINSYEENNAALRGAVVQLDFLNNEVTEQIHAIKNSKTIKKKYDYISDLSAVSSNIISSKISAIRELNNTISKCHDLELKRTKELKLTTDDKTDDQRLMDMYNAYISVPMGTRYPTPNPIDLVTQSGGLNQFNNTNEDFMYQQYQQNKTPEQNYMLQLEDPNIKTVVVYDRGTGQRRFDVIDMSTGQSVPNMPLPDPAFLDDTNINLKTGMARNSNINMNYPLIVVGDDSINKF